MIRRYKLFNSPSLRYLHNWRRSGWVRSLDRWWRLRCELTDVHIIH